MMSSCLPWLEHVVSDSFSLRENTHDSDAEENDIKRNITETEKPRATPKYGLLLLLLLLLFLASFLFSSHAL